MVRIFTAPNRYIQGCGVLENIGKYVSHLGHNFFILGGKSALSSIRSEERRVGKECKA
jgi:glycerol dehydrogenase-like iron-containing ADH family enzyme